MNPTNQSPTTSVHPPMSRLLQALSTYRPPMDIRHKSLKEIKRLFWISLGAFPKCTTALWRRSFLRQEPIQCFEFAH